MEILRTELKVRLIIDGKEEFLKKVEEITVTMDKLNVLFKELNEIELKAVMEREQ